MSREWLLGMAGLLALGLVSMPSSAVGQVATADWALRGHESVFASTLITWDERITSTTEAQFEREMLNGLELGLLRAGLTLSEPPDGFGGPHELRCKVILLNVTTRGVAYSLHAQLLEHVTSLDDKYLLEAITWEAAAVGTAPIVDGDEMGRDCAEWFELAWRKAQQG